MANITLKSNVNAAGYSSIGSNAVYGVHIYMNVDSMIAGIWVYVKSSNAANQTLTGHLYPDDNTSPALATGTVGITPNWGWAYMPFASPVKLTGNVRYKLAIYSGYGVLWSMANQTGASETPSSNGYTLTVVGSDWVGGAYNSGDVNPTQGGGISQQTLSGGVDVVPPPNAPTVTYPNGGETLKAQHTIRWTAASHPSDMQTVSSTTYTDDVIAGYYYMSQVFTNRKDAWLKSFGIFLRGQSAGVSATIRLRTVRWSNGVSLWEPDPAGTVYVTKTVTLSTTPAEYVVTLPSAVKFAVGGIVCIEVEAPATGVVLVGATFEAWADGQGITYTNDRNQVYGFSSGTDVRINLNYDTSALASQLKYQVMLSINGGSSFPYPLSNSSAADPYSTANLTTAGVTSINYDFSAIPATTTGYVAIRAYDGAAFGPWDYSNGLFTIEPNVAPNAPTHKNISNLGSTINPRPKFFFNVSDPDAGGTITDFSVQISRDSTFATIDVLAAGYADGGFSGLPTSGATGTVTFNYPANFNACPVGTLYLRARALDNKGAWSAWSATQQFTVAAVAWSDTVPDDAAGFKAQWLNDLATVINNVRQFRGLAAATFTDGTMDATKDIKPVHVTERRTNLEAVLSAVGVTPPVWTDTTLNNTIDRKGVHVKELRNAVLSDDWTAFNEGWDNGCPYPTLFTTVNSVTNGILNVTSTTADPGIEMYRLGLFDPNVYRYLELRYRIVSGGATGWEAFPTNTTYTTANGAMALSAPYLIADGQWHTASIDCWTGANYKTGGNITGWRLDWAITTGVNMEIDYVRLRK